MADYTVRDVKSGSVLCDTSSFREAWDARDAFTKAKRDVKLVCLSPCGCIRHAIVMRVHRGWRLVDRCSVHASKRGMREAPYNGSPEKPEDRT